MIYQKKTKVTYNPNDSFPIPVLEYVNSAIENGQTNGEYVINIKSQTEFIIERVWINQTTAESYIDFIINNHNIHNLGPLQYTIIDNV